MKQRKLGPFQVSALGLGCMNLSHAYGVPPGGKEATELLLRALDLGYTFFDTAAMYGFGDNETLLGKALSARRDEFVLASKCGLHRNDEGKREINGRPDVLRRTLEGALKRLRTDVIDLYYLHRWDKDVPIEESVGAMADMVAEGKVRTLGLSEVSAATLRKAHAVHPITALQSEYSLWTRNPEIATLAACAELGTTFVAFSPLGRGFLCGLLRDPGSLVEEDFRRPMPRFQPDTFARNLPLLDRLAEITAAAGITMAQAALAWTLSRGEHVVPIPGTTNLAHLEENAAAAALDLDAGTLARLDAAINRHTVAGARYAPASQAQIDTEEFA